MSAFADRRRSKRWLRLVAIAVILAGGLAPPVAAATEIVVGTGSLYGVYYRLGKAVCELFNRSAESVNCNAVPTAGSQANIVGLRDGSLDIAVVQSDVQFHAVEGSGPFSSGNGPYKDLRALFSVHGEPFTLVVRRDSGIRVLRDLAGRRINIGNPGSGQRATTEVVMAAMGWTHESFSLAADLPASQQSHALCDGKIDAMAYVVGHPNESIKRATDLCDSMVIEVGGPEIAALVAAHPFYSAMTIPGGLYAGNPDPVKTFGVRATVVTSARLDAGIAYAIVKTVFGDLDRFRAMSPAFRDLRAEDMVWMGLSAPLHPGAVRYFRDTGVKRNENVGSAADKQGDTRDR